MHEVAFLLRRNKASAAFHGCTYWEAQKQKCCLHCRFCCSSWRAASLRSSIFNLPNDSITISKFVNNFAGVSARNRYKASPNSTGAQMVGLSSWHDAHPKCFFTLQNDASCVANVCSVVPLFEAAADPKTAALGSPAALKDDSSFLFSHLFNIHFPWAIGASNCYERITELSEVGFLIPRQSRGSGTRQFCHFECLFILRTLGEPCIVPWQGVKGIPLNRRRPFAALCEIKATFGFLFDFVPPSCFCNTLRSFQSACRCRLHQLRSSPWKRQLLSFGLFLWWVLCPTLISFFTQRSW